MEKKLLFVKILFYIGAVADVIATLPLLFPELAQLGFGLEAYKVNNDYLYISRMGAALMLGWGFLLFWGGSKPVERKGLLLITLFPVVFGMIISSILVVTSGFVEAKFMISMWIYYALLVPAYIYGYYVALKIEAD